VILKTQFFLSMLKTKRSCLLAPHHTPLQFRCNILVFTLLSSPSYFFFNHQLSICDLHILVQSFVFLFSKNLFMFPENHITIFLYFFLIIPPQFNPQTHKKNIQKLLKLLQFILVVHFCPTFMTLYSILFFVTPSCHPFFLTGPFEDPQISKEKRIANAYSRKRKTLAFKIHL